MSRIFLYRKGFTLIELLLVIGIVGVLASIVVVAVNPAEQFEKARNARRNSDANQIEKALVQYVINGNSLPAAVLKGDDAGTAICRQGVVASNCVSFDSALIPDYLAEIPQDDEETNPNFSGYVVKKDNEGRPVVRSAYTSCWLPGLVGMWRFNEGSGNIANDTSGYGHNGTLVNMNAADWVTDTVGDNNTFALDFDGVNDYIQVNNVPALGTTYSIVALVKHVSGSDIYISRGLPYFAVYSTTPLFSWVLSSQQSMYGTSNAIPYNTWTHAAAVHDGSVARIYINGAINATKATATASVPSSSWQFGNHYGSSYWYTGKLDEIAFFNTALTENQIAFMYECRGY